MQKIKPLASWRLRGSTALAVLIQKIMLILSKKNITLCVLRAFAVQEIIALEDLSASGRSYWGLSVWVCG